MKRILFPNKKKPYYYDIESILIKNLIPRNKPFFDVGANIGVYSILAEDVVGEKNLYIFEPLPELYNFLSYLFNKSSLFKKALSDKQEKQIFNIPIINNKLTKTRASLESHIKEIDQSGTHKIEITTTTLDNFIKSKNLSSIGFIKIDVEGHEFKTLLGGVDSIKKFSPILFVEIEQRHHISPIIEIFEYILDLGYNGYFLDPKEINLKSIDSFISSIQKTNDLLENRNTYINNFIFFPNKQNDFLVSKCDRILRENYKIIRDNMNLA